MVAAMTDHDVVIAGGGPTGMTLAAELALAGVDVAVVERRSTSELAGSRAGGLHARTIELFDQRGVADRFLAAGQVAQVAGFALNRFDISDFPTRHPYGLALWQDEIERILAGWVDELPVTFRRGVTVTGFTQDVDGVDVAVSSGRTLRARYLVGCDGGRSVIRKAAGISFPGWDASTSALLAEVELAEEPEWGLRRDALGMHGLSRQGDDGPVRVMVTEREVGGAAEPTLEDLRAGLQAVYGTDFGLRAASFVSRFTDMTRQAASYRESRVLLAGDAAHVHAPAGGQGLQLGVHDAFNLGWKLAQVVRETSPDALLDTYQAERHPVTARVLRDTMAAMTLSRGDEQTAALRDVVAELVAMDEPRIRLAGRLSGLAIRYDLGDGHPLLGRRMPDLDLAGEHGPLRVFSLLHTARPLLLELAPVPFDAAPWADRVQAVRAAYAGAWELPVLGAVPAPTAVLVRPDGYVAWVGEGTADGLAGALETWFGPPVRR
jgi:3-(3-hydroxy-phenyl)propionate hydroxylase